LTVLVLTVVLDLARGRVRKALDRRFSREKYQLDVTLQRMGQAVGQLVDPPQVAQRLLSTWRQSTTSPSPQPTGPAPPANESQAR